MPFLDAINEAIAAAPDAHLRYGGLQKGVAILTSQQDVDAYLACYGQMHYAKLEDSVSRIDVTTLAAQPLEIWDWGCGVGIGLFSLLDKFTRFHIPTDRIFRVVLLDPSDAMRTRALSYVAQRYAWLYATASVHASARSFAQVTPGFLPTAAFAAKLHILSNVIDIPGLDVHAFATTITGMFRGLNKFLLVSPANARVSDGIDRFSAVVERTAASYVYTERNETLRKNIYRPIPAPGAYRIENITLTERTITAVLP